jgi:hypothetical protein
MHVPNSIPLWCSLPLTVRTFYDVQHCRVLQDNVLSSLAGCEGTVRVVDRNFHSRMPLVPTPARLK